MDTKKSKINLGEGILQVIGLLLLWFGKIADYTIAGGEVYDMNLNANILYKKSSGSIYFKDFFDTLGLFATMIIVLSACNLIMCFVSAYSKNKSKDGVIHTIVPIITFALSIFVYGQGVINITASTRQCVCTYTAVKTIVLILYFIVIVLSFLKRSNLIVPDDSKRQINSYADDLKKYKDLLDSGAITQAEFDAKKKQLLGL